MGLDAFEQNENNVSRDTTVQDLIDDVGERAVIRGLKYMYSLADADQEYRESVSPEHMEEGYRQAGVEGEEVKEVSEKWAERVNSSGIGIDESDEE